MEAEAVAEEHIPPESDSPSEMSDLDYVKHHHLHELIDMLIFQVSAAKPKNPAAYMAYLLRERINAREGGVGAPQPVTELCSSTLQVNTTGPPVGRSSNPNAFGTPYAEFSPTGNSTPSGFQKFGLWIQVQNDDVPRIIQRFRQLCKENSVEPPEDFTKDTAALLRTLSRASAIYFYKGFAEARSIIPLKPHRAAPSACIYLQRAITDIITFVTISQRRYLSNFMECLIEELRVDDVNEIEETGRYWKAFRTSSNFTSVILQRMKKYLRQFDEMITFEPFFDVYFQWIDMVIEHRDMPAAERQAVMQRTYPDHMTLPGQERSFPRMPDRFAVFASLVLSTIRDVPEAAEFPERSFSCVQKLLFSILEDENSIALNAASSALTSGSYPLRLRRGDPGLILLLSQFFNNGFRKRISERMGRGSKDTFLAVLANKSGYVEKLSESFLKAGRCILRKELQFNESDNFMIRCSAYTRIRLLQYFVEVIQKRTELTMDEVELTLLRCRCFGVTIGTFFVYLNGLLDATGLPQNVIEESKFIFRVVQDICSSVSSSPALAEFSAAFHSLRECTESSTDGLLNVFNGAPPFTDTALELLFQFLDLSGVLLAFGTAFDYQSSASTDHYFNVSTLMATRMQVAHLYSTSSCNYVAMGLLSGIHELAEKTSTPLYVLLPACEVVAGWSAPLYYPPECSLADGDRQMLFSYFSEHMQSRALLSAIQNFVKLMPEFRSRVIRPSISYERAQLCFSSLLVELLSLKSMQEKEVLYRVIAEDLGVQGMKAEDFDLFSLSLTYALREPGFPEALWNLFMYESIKQIKKFLPKLKPLHLYQPELQVIIRIQRKVRGLIQQRGAEITPEDKELLEKLLEELGEEPLNDSLSPQTSISRAEGDLIALSWRLLENLNKADAIYCGVTAVSSAVPSSSKELYPADGLGHSLVSPRFSYGASSQVERALSVLAAPHSPKRHRALEEKVARSTTMPALEQQAIYEEAKALFKKCRVVADHLTTFIKLACTRNKGNDWRTIWKRNFHGDFHSFFESLIEPDQFMQFTVGFIEKLRQHQVFKHPMLRLIWSNFASCFDRMVKSVED